METCKELFDVDRYNRRAPTRMPRHRRRPLAMSPNVWLALLSLKDTLDSIPETELHERDRTYHENLAKSAAR